MKKIIIIAITTLTIISCKKPNDESCTTSVASISGAYKITAVTYKASATAAQTNYYTILFPDACERDNLYTFNINGTYQIADVGIVCNPPQNDNGTWSLAGNIMTIDGAATVIESFNCQSLVIVNEDTQVNGDKLKITLTKQ